MSVNMEEVRQRFPTNPGYIDDAGQEQNAGHLRLTREDWDSARQSLERVVRTWVKFDGDPTFRDFHTMDYLASRPARRRKSRASRPNSTRKSALFRHF